MKITYDNNSKSKAVYNGELILNGEKTGLLMEINFIPHCYRKLQEVFCKWEVEI